MLIARQSGGDGIVTVAAIFVDDTAEPVLILVLLSVELAQ